MSRQKQNKPLQTDERRVSVHLIDGWLSRRSRLSGRTVSQTYWLSIMSEAPVYVVPYDPSWIDKFESEKAFLEQLLAPWRKGPIEHVGSTAVVGLCAKPVIDIMVGVTSLSESEPAKDILRQAGYQYAEYKTDVMHWFCKPSLTMRTHHLHLVPFESPLWHERLAFRNLLRTNSRVAEEYAALKRELARRFAFDREAYTDAKYPFIVRALGLSRVDGTG